MRKGVLFLIALLLLFHPVDVFHWNQSMEVFAQAWPSDVSVSAEGAILMDADSGAVLYGKNMHEKYFPASITKILTALVIIENCDLNEELTFSYSAIHNVEENSSNAGFAVGDTITVRDALYALLLKSANEAANALAEHCSGSVEEFAKLMTSRAEELGCLNSSFRNPSGLNDPNHYVTAYDYALISKAAFANPLFVEIDSTTYYPLPATKNYPEGQTIYTHHAMLKRSNQQYYPGIFGGKTGYTTLAGNTLVTGAQRDGLRLITVVLNSKKTHYADTKALLDFGFSNFKNVDIQELDPDFLSVMGDIDLIKNSSRALKMEDKKSVTLLKEAEPVDIQREIDFNLSEKDPSQAIAKVSYSYEDRVIGTTYLLSNFKAKSHIASDATTSGESDAMGEGAAPSGNQNGTNTDATAGSLQSGEALVADSAANESLMQGEGALSESIQEERVAPFQTDANGNLVNDQIETNAQEKQSNLADIPASTESAAKNGAAHGLFGQKDVGKWIQDYLYFLYVIATLLIIAIIVAALKLGLFIRDKIAIARRRKSKKNGDDLWE